MRGSGLLRLTVVPLLLVALHFGLRPRLGDPRLTPDFLLLALLTFALHVRPGAGAVAGFLIGLATDAVAPTAFGAAALAGTVVGFGAGWVRTLFVADNVLVAALFVFGASWVRDLIQVVASNQLGGSGLAWQLLVLSPGAAVSTAVAGLVVLFVTSRWPGASRP